MDASIFSFTKSLAAFCNHIEFSSRALSESVQRKPIPLDSAAAAFLQALERRVSSASSDLNLINSMVFDTVSFEEILGYCNEVYKANEKLISEVEDRMRSFGYIPYNELEDEENEQISSDVRLSSTDKVFDGKTSTMQKPILEDDLFDDFISLKNLALSEASLAALAAEGPSTKATIMISEDDYDKLPAFMKELSSWEELQEGVERFNSYLSGSNGRDGRQHDTLDQAALEKLDLGRKGRTYLLLLLRMNKISAESVNNGSFAYRVNGIKF